MNRLQIGLASAIVAIATLVAFEATPKREYVLGSFSTSFEGRMASQKHNALLSLKGLDGRTVGPGETFSFNDSVGTWTRDRGYRKAPVSYNGQLVSSWGGGVCQTSTTLYNAALLAGMAIVERHPHVFLPSYIQPGRDAAVAFRDVDLRFRNPFAFPVEIRTRAVGERIEVAIIASQRPPKAPQVLVEVLGRRQPAEYVIAGETGYGRVRNSGKAGYEVLVWRVSGGVKELVSRDDYPAMNRIVEYR